MMIKAPLMGLFIMLKYREIYIIIMLRKIFKTNPTICTFELYYKCKAFWEVQKIEFFDVAYERRNNSDL